MGPAGTLLAAPGVFQSQSATGDAEYDGTGTVTPAWLVTFTGATVAVCSTGGIVSARRTPVGAVTGFWTPLPQGPVPYAADTIAAGHDESSKLAVFQPAGGEAGV